MTNNNLISAPRHVAECSIFDFDIYGDSLFGDDLHRDVEKLHEKAPDVFYSRYNGGHWVLTRHKEISEIVQDQEYFSPREQQIPRVSEPPVLIPLSMDPPNNLPFRQALMRAFSPKSIKDMEPKIRFWAEKIISDIAKKGECDFVNDVGSVFPVSIFMELMGMDLSRLREFRELADNYFGSLDNEMNMLKYNNMILEIMTEYIEQKKKCPDDRLITQLIGAKIDGRPIEMSELQNMCTLLFQGGLHTVTNLSAFAYWNLAKDFGIQQALQENPDKIPAFSDESIRMFGVVNTPRIVVKDCERFGVKFKQGDMVLCMLPLAGRDDRVNEDASEFKLDRSNRQHLTFSKGPHLCVGSFLARTELRILTEEWFKKIPNFSIPGNIKQSFSTSAVFGLSSLPLVWDT